MEYAPFRQSKHGPFYILVWPGRAIEVSLLLGKVPLFCLVPKRPYVEARLRYDRRGGVGGGVQFVAPVRAR
jgi:hypothetical protein